MTSAAPVLYAPASAAIESPETAEDWAAARALVSEFFAYVQAESGLDLPTVQPRSARELDALSALYVPPEGRFFIARVDGEIVGTTAIHRLSQDIFEMKRVYVKPEARGLKLASKMLDAAILEARKLGARSLVLESHPEFMAVAAKMYRKRGFKEISSFSNLSMHLPGIVTMGLTLHMMRNR